MKAFLSLLVLAVMSRIVPHPANVTAMTALAVLGPCYLSRRLSIACVMLALLLSDALLAWQQHSLIIGSWSVFSYSGFFLIAFLTQTNRLRSLPVATLFYWSWTNLGVWITAGLYPQTASGLLACYSAALPFLRNALLGDLLWYGILLYSLNALVKADKFRYNGAFLSSREMSSQ